MALRFITAVTLTGLLSTQFLAAQVGWYSTDWQCRMPVTVSNPGTTHLSGFQVQIILTGGTEGDFDFTKAKSDGSDIRVTSDNGVTLIPFFIESWAAYNESPRKDTIWVKVPNIPTTGTTVYIYYGNDAGTITEPTYVPYYPDAPPSGPPVETPPAGPFTRAENNPVRPIGDPGYPDHPEYGLGASLLAENIVYDNVTGHYWMVFANYRIGAAGNGKGVGLIWSDTPTDPESWHWHGNVWDAADQTHKSLAPHIIYHDGLWYIFFSLRPNIVYITSPTITGPYSSTYGNLPAPPTIVLSPTTDDDWEDFRVDEPYVFQRDDGQWIMLYMGDDTGAVEQVGYAIADNITGPYIKFGDTAGDNSTSTPCIPFGPAGSYDYGTVADPWAYNYHGTYYIGYAVSSTKNPPWITALATTTDWQTFTKEGILFDAAGSSGGWETNKSFRGAVTRINDEYVLAYTGGSGGGSSDPPGSTYLMGIATQPVYMTPSDPINNYTDPADPLSIGDNPDAVFDFYDGFDTGTYPDPLKWTFESGTTGMSTIANGMLTLTTTGGGADQYVILRGATSFTSDMKYVGETRARHPSWNGLNGRITEYGFKEAETPGASILFTNTIRLFDDYLPNTALYGWNARMTGNPGGFNSLSEPVPDVDWHIYRVSHRTPGNAGFQVDNGTLGVTTVAVPTVALQPFIMSYGLANNSVIDWIRVRQWASADPFSTPGNEESLTTQWTGSISSDWGTAGNWTAGAPAGWSIITIPGTTTPPVLNGPLTISPTASLIVDSGGALTVNGDLNNSGLLTINSTLTSSGSLIVSGTSTGNITYNRQLKPGAAAERDWHLAASPVTANSAANSGKISAVYQWAELSGIWSATGITSVIAGHGYNIRQETVSDGGIAFTGPLANGDVIVEASSPYNDAINPDDSYYNRDFAADRSLTDLGGGGWNLLGNPYPSAISAEEFINANYNVTPALSQFDPNYVALYLFDGTDRSYYYLANSTGWPAGGELSATHVQAGQGFFVLAMNDNSAFHFTRAMREHSTATTMLKSGKTEDRWPGLQLKVKHAAGEVLTTVVYNGSMTTGVDPGYDIGLFKSGQELEIYTSLALKDNGINYTRQALPLSGADTLVIPVGVDYSKGGEVTFSATTVPLDGRRLWLQDKVTGIFTDLSLKSYTVNLPADTYGTGRFFIIASANTPTAISHPDTPEGDLRIWVSGNRLVIKGVVSNASLCELFDMQGQKILFRKLTDGELNTIDLPDSVHGVLVVRVTDGVKVTTEKIVIP